MKDFLILFLDFCKEKLIFIPIPNKLKKYALKKLINIFDCIKKKNNKNKKMNKKNKKEHNKKMSIKILNKNNLNKNKQSKKKLKLLNKTKLCLKMIKKRIKLKRVN